MKYVAKNTVVCGLAAGAFLCVAACSPRHVPSLTLDDMVSDRVTLDGVLIKCNAHPATMNSDSDCLTARVAIERLAKAHELGEQTKHAEEFERIREQLRLSQDKVRSQHEAAQKVDPYNLPLVPEDSSPASGPATGQSTPPSEGPLPMMGQTKP